MKKIFILFILFICILTSCQKKDEISGYLFFKLVNIQSENGMSIDDLNKLKNNLEKFRKKRLSK